MASIGGILPIPEQTIVGTGTYVIPANRYAYFCANVASTTWGWSGQTSHYNSTSESPSDYFHSANAGGPTRSASASTNNHIQTLSAGDTITVSETSVTSQIDHNPAGYARWANYGSTESRVLINGTSVCMARSSGSCFTGYNNASSSGYYTGVKGYNTQGWSCALYRKPIGNLPEGAAEGEA